MQQTTAKALVRNYFYQEFLPTQLSQSLIRGGNYLVLLGEDSAEEQMLSVMGVPPHRIYSVERESQVFQAQSLRARRGELNVVLYYGELIEFITHYLQTNQRFLVLNLDIYGAYKNHIDPVMTPILLFARRNPRTVIATYSNAARDRPQLHEGLKSLAICQWLAPVATQEMTEELFDRYRSSGLSPKVSFHMVLRNLFWLRSHMEHVLLSSVALGNVAAANAQKLLQAFERCWEQTITGIEVPLRYEAFMAAVAVGSVAPSAPVFDLSVESVSIVTYEAHNHMYHMGWFATYKSVDPMPAADWLGQACTAMISEALRFANREVVELDLCRSTGHKIPPELVIWSGEGLQSAGRKLRIPLSSEQLSTMSETIVRAPSEASVPARITRRSKPPIVESTAQPMPASEGAAPVSQKTLSGGHIAKIREAAVHQPTATTAQIVKALRLQNYPQGSVTAHIALARRKR